jgi:hypothetical protein
VRAERRGVAMEKVAKDRMVWVGRSVRDFVTVLD